MSTHSKSFNYLLAIALLFTLASGALRKWVFETGVMGNLVFAFQLASPLLLLLAKFEKHTASKQKAPWAGFYFFVLFLLALNPLSQSIFHGIVGFYLYALFFMAMQYYFIHRHEINLTPLFWVIFAAAALEFFLGAAQYFLPETHILNKLPKINGVELGAAKVGDNLRVSGTFAYLGAYSTFVALVGYLTWSQLVLKKRLPFLVPFVLSGLGCALFSGSRGALIAFGIYLFFGLSAYLSSLKETIKLSLIFVPVFVILSYLDLGGLSKTFSKGISNIEQRFGDKKIQDSDLKGRSLTPLTAIVDFSLPVGSEFFGIGLSATYQGTNIIWGTSEAARKVGGWEDEVGRVLIEGGYLLYLFRILIMWYVVQKMSWPKWMRWPFFIFLFFFSQIVVNIYSCIFAFIGLMFVDNAYYRKRLEQFPEEPIAGAVEAPSIFARSKPQKLNQAPHPELDSGSKQ